MGEPLLLDSGPVIPDLDTTKKESLINATMAKVIMLLLLLDGVLKKIFHTGRSRILGDQTGEIKVTSKSREELVTSTRLDLYLLYLRKQLARLAPLNLHHLLLLLRTVI